MNSNYEKDVYYVIAVRAKFNYYEKSKYETCYLGWADEGYMRYAYPYDSLSQAKIFDTIEGAVRWWDENRDDMVKYNNGYSFMPSYAIMRVEVTPCYPPCEVNSETN